MGVFKVVKTLDAYPKMVEDFRVRTISGATISIIAAIFIILLTISEFRLYIITELRPELTVDSSIGEKLTINFDITFPSLPCSYMSIDAMDATGEYQLLVEHDVYKIRLSPDGTAIESDKHELNLKVDLSISNDSVQCGDCYGAHDEQVFCCNTCSQVQEQYRKKGWRFLPENVGQCVREGFLDKIKQQHCEGCRVHGKLLVNKVRGNFHIAPGKPFQTNHMHIHDLGALNFEDHFDLTHKIHFLNFGNEYPGLVNPLDGSLKTFKAPRGKSAIYEYYIKLVPTIYKDENGNSLKTNQFSVTEFERNIDLTSREQAGLPGIFFMYDISPIMISFTNHRPTIPHFITSLCAIIGGVFTVAGIIDTFIYQGMRNVRKSSIH